MVMTSWEWEKAKSWLPDGFEPTTPEEKLLAILTIRNLGTDNVLHDIHKTWWLI